MWLTTSSELAPGQWVDLTLTHTVGMNGIFILIYVSSLMFVMRHFAGPIAHRLSSIGLLWLSSLLAAIGLFALSRANSPVTAMLAATIWGAGVCFMWPTMLAVVSERFVRGGALAMGLMGFTGGMAIQFLLPLLGRVFDDAKNLAAGGADKLASLSAEQTTQVIQIASRESFQMIALVPLLLLPIFAAIWWSDQRQKKTV
jgi:MFS family permease